jgi:hypothetical protein
MIDELVELTTQRSELELSSTDRAQVNHTFQHWFEAVNKRQCPDLEQKVADFKAKMSKLALVIKFTWQYGGDGKDLILTASADGAPGQTLQQMKVGTLWFNGWKNLEYEVLCVIGESR